jgi:hypothetical protein
MIFADTTPTWQSSVAVAAMLGSLLSVICGVLVVLYMRRQTQLMAEANQKPPSPISPQPLKVQIDEELHEKFADRGEFEKHISSNTDRHAQLFRAIERVERETRAEMDRRFVTLAEDRKETMEKLNEQFTFIRENISAINRELQITHRK